MFKTQNSKILNEKIMLQKLGFEIIGIGNVAIEEVEQNPTFRKNCLFTKKNLTYSVPSVILYKI
jgi:hypothetical protein